MTTVRQATLADREAIFSFIRQAYEGRWQYKIPERWDWAYRDNPYWDGPGLPIWIALDEDGRVIGQAGALLEPLQLGGQSYQVSWGVDAFVLPEFRGQGIGTRLQEAHFQTHPIFMSINMSSRIRSIKEKLGSQAVDPVITFVKVLQHDSASVQERLGRGTAPGSNWLPGLAAGLRMDRGLAWALNTRLSRREASWQSRLDPDIKIQAVDEFSAGFDGLWERLAPRFYALAERNKAYLNWKYLQQPHIQHQIFTTAQGGQLCGYIILRQGRPPEPNLGIIADLFTAPEDEATTLALLVHGIGFLRARGCQAVVAGTSVKAFQNRLLGLGFRAQREYSPLFFCRPALSGCREALEPGRWLLGIGDQDWNQFPNARILFG